MSEHPAPAESPPPDPEIDALLDFAPVRRATNRHDGWTPERQRGFIAELARTGSIDDAAQSVGRTASGVWKVRQSAGAASFAAAWDGALALWHARNPKAARIGRPSRGARLAEAAAVPEPSAAEREAAEAADSGARAAGLDDLMAHYLMKLDAERTARLAGRPVEADLYVRQLTWLEVCLCLGGRGKPLLDSLALGNVHVGRIVATPMSLYLDQVRRLHWANGGEPERPPPADLGVHTDDFATGPALECQYRPDRDGDMAGWPARRAARETVAAAAQRAWEDKAQAEAAAWRARITPETDPAESAP